MTASFEIESIDAYEVVVPNRAVSLGDQSLANDGRWDLMPICLLEVKTTEGLIGLGEVSRGITLSELKPWLSQLPGTKHFGWSTLGNPTSWNEGGKNDLLQRHPTPFWQSRSPLGSALEMARLDILGKKMGCRVVDLLGGAYTESLPVHYWCTRLSVEDLSSNVRLALASGFKGIKIKARMGDPVVQQVEAIRELAGPTFQIVIDPMFQWYSPLDAIVLFKTLESMGGALSVEDPFPQEMPEFWERLRTVCSIPLIWHARTLGSLQTALSGRCMDAFNCGGGFAEFSTMAHALEVVGYSCWHGTAVELGVAQVAQMHAAAAARACVLPSDFVSGFVREHTLINWGWPYKNGLLPLPLGTGLGIELDRDAIERFVTTKTVLTR